MKTRYLLITAAVLMIFSLVGCSRRDESAPSSSPSHMVSPTPGTSFSLPPENDAMEGGGAGGTNDPDSGLGGEPAPTQSAGPDGNDIMDDIEDGVNDMIDGAGEAVDDAIDGVNNTLRDRTARDRMH